MQNKPEEEHHNGVVILISFLSPQSVGAEVSSVQTNGESVTPAAAAPVVRLGKDIHSVLTIRYWCF